MPEQEQDSVPEPDPVQKPDDNGVEEAAGEVVAVADESLLAAHELALAALLEITPESTIGPVVGHVVEGDHVLSLLFECTLLGYPGWHWTVTLARVDSDAEPVVLEAELLPGEHALLAPDWVPWSERLAEYQAAQEAARAADGADGESSDDEPDESDEGDDDVDDLDDDDEDGLDALDDDDSVELEVDFDGIDVDLHDTESGADDDGADDDGADDDSVDEDEADDDTGDDIDVEADEISGAEEASLDEDEPFDEDEPLDDAESTDDAESPDDAARETEE